MVSIITEVEHLLSRRVHIDTTIHKEEQFDKFTDAVYDSFFNDATPIKIYTIEGDLRRGTYEFAHLYNLGSYYVVLEYCVESCSGCYHVEDFDSIVVNMINKAYVTESLSDAQEYINSQNYIEDKSFYEP